ncbi:MAG: TfoX family protein [Alphaproteobacteria bacterium]|nr:TfoX family protein [Alphaproteobacteria bacterium]
MAFNREFRDHVLDLLEPLGVTARAMFGGVGFFVERAMFALIADDRFYLKVDDSNRGDYEAAGSVNGSMTPREDARWRCPIGMHPTVCSTTAPRCAPGQASR